MGKTVTMKQMKTDIRFWQILSGILAAGMILLGVLAFRDRQPAGISIGVAQPGQGGTAVDFSAGSQVTDEQQISRILTAMIQAETLSPEQIPTEAPEGVLMLPAEGNTAYTFSFWLREDGVIFTPGNDREYRWIPAQSDEALHGLLGDLLNRENP